MKPQKALMRIPQVLVMVAVFVAGLLDMVEPNQRVIAAALMLAFSIILFSPFFWHGPVIRIHIALATLSVLTAVLMVMGPGWNFFPILFFLLSATATVYLPIKIGLGWIGLFTLITTVIFYMLNGPMGLALLLPFVAGYAFFGIFGWVTVDSERNRLRSEHLLVDLQAAHQQLQEYASRVEELTISQERNRIAREMHDTLGHRLTIASVQLEGAQRLIPTNPERAVTIVETVREQVKEGLTDLRRTVAMLRATVEEDLPLDQALTRLADQVQQATGLKIHLSLENCPEHLSIPQHQALYRAAQESLTNIQRHARASEAWLRLSSQDGIIELLISDNGIGATPEQAQLGFGLLGLKERAAIQGGEFYIDGRPGGGTQITFRIPLVREDQVPPADQSNGGTHE